jgi:hypothetical protein
MLVCDLIEDVDINGDSVCIPDDSFLLGDISSSSSSRKPTDIYDQPNPYNPKPPKPYNPKPPNLITKIDCRFSFCRPNWQFVSRNLKAVGISSIYSILGFAQCHFLYYGCRADACFNPHFCDFSDEISGLLGGKKNKLQTDSAKVFLSDDLFILVKNLWLAKNFTKILDRATDISTDMYNCVGWPNWDTGQTLSTRSYSKGDTIQNIIDIQTERDRERERKREDRIAGQIQIEQNSAAEEVARAQARAQAMEVAPAPALEAPALEAPALEAPASALKAMEVAPASAEEVARAQARAQARAVLKRKNSPNTSDAPSAKKKNSVINNMETGGKKMKTRKNPKKIKKPKKTKRRYSTIANKRTRRNK